MPALRDAGFGLRPHGRGWASELLSGTGFEVVTARRGSTTSAAQYRARGETGGLLLTGSIRTAPAMRLAGVAALGHRGDFRALLLERAVTRDRELHQVEQDWTLGRHLRDWLAPEVPWPDAVPVRTLLPVTDEQERTAAGALAAAGVTTPFLLPCPLAVGRVRGVARIWPHWSDLAAELHARGHELVTAAGPGEEAHCRRLLPNARHLPGLKLGAYAGLSRSAVLTLANDSGPMHLASVAGGRVLGLFGITNPALSRPLTGAFAGEVGSWPRVEEVLELIEVEAGASESPAFRQGAAD